ncbi:MAG: hypothetical protein H7145_11890 [Akkermansiaceae bacterium]|nr:hypothetical protein [Armatimonadota bacterium]
MNEPLFHRHAGDYFSADEWGGLSPANKRVARALGTAPLADARHLLLPIATSRNEAGGETSTSADFSIRLTPTAARTAADLSPYFAHPVRAALDFPRVTAHIPSRVGGDNERTLPLDTTPDTARVRAVTLTWSLPDLISIGSERDAVADLRRFLAEVGRIGIDAGMTVTALQDPADAARHAVTIRTLLRKLGGQSELRLVPVSGSFASRDVWRALYSLGLTWGNMDLFHWHGGNAVTASGAGTSATSRFRVLSSGTPPYFLPERAVEGERVPGLILEYDLPHAPDPVAVFDRMAIALSYLRSVLGGHPVTKGGAELDADHLDAERDALENAIQAMTNAGIAPGSDTALRFF